MARALRIEFADVVYYVATRGEGQVCALAKAAMWYTA